VGLKNQTKKHLKNPTKPLKPPTKPLKTPRKPLKNPTKLLKKTPKYQFFFLVKVGNPPLKVAEKSPDVQSQLKGTEKSENFHSLF